MSIDRLRTIPCSILSQGQVTHLVSGSGRYLGFLTMRPKGDYRYWELQVFEPQQLKLEDVNPMDVRTIEQKVAYRIITLLRRHEVFNAGKRGRFDIFQYEVAPGEEKLLWDLEPGMFISAGELFGERKDG